MLLPFWGVSNWAKSYFRGLPDFCVILGKWCKLPDIFRVGDPVRAILGVIQFFYLNSNISLIISHSGGSRLGHRASGTRSKPPNLNENGRKPHFSRLRSRSKFCPNPPLSRNETLNFSCLYFYPRHPRHNLGRQACSSHFEEFQIGQSPIFGGCQIFVSF